ncbi:hypothetical protein SAMN06269250_5685 [Spirosoma fluviale]|uniref:Uncharacterized protein n=1 Tax=Spirosoma fluviale TaxID=1597977 RepID=A0A286GNR0_9BACT|nr:hypothetical protein SAMN06269250_5685 [Spirosoma fluviale]
MELSYFLFISPAAIGFGSLPVRAIDFFFAKVQVNGWNLPIFMKINERYSGCFGDTTHC